MPIVNKPLGSVGAGRISSTSRHNLTALSIKNCGRFYISVIGKFYKSHFWVIACAVWSTPILCPLLHLLPHSHWLDFKLMNSEAFSTPSRDNWKTLALLMTDLYCPVIQQTKTDRLTNYVRYQASYTTDQIRWDDSLLKKTSRADVGKHAVPTQDSIISEHPVYEWTN